MGKAAMVKKSNNLNTCPCVQCPVLDLLKGDRCCSTSGSDRLQVVHHAFGGQGKYNGDDELGEEKDKGETVEDQCDC